MQIVSTNANLQTVLNGKRDNGYYGLQCNENCRTVVALFATATAPAQQKL